MGLDLYDSGFCFRGGDRVVDRHENPVKIFSIA
jgi:hypothetical protein